jgi:hypothetical protein
MAALGTLDSGAGGAGGRGRASSGGSLAAEQGVSEAARFVMEALPVQGVQGVQGGQEGQAGRGRHGGAEALPQHLECFLCPQADSVASAQLPAQVSGESRSPPPAACPGECPPW